MKKALSEMEPIDLFHSDNYDEYKKHISLFHTSQLTPLNVNIFIMEKILSFPFDLLAEAEPQVFFSMIINNFFEISLLSITRLIKDKSGDLFTLLQFKNWIRSNLREEYRDEYQYLLKEVKFNNEIKHLLDKAKKIRNSQIAHLMNNQALKDFPRIDFNELKILTSEVNKLFITISFGVDSLLLPLEYSPRVKHPIGSDNRTDIEKILDSVAKESLILNLPESDPIYWKSYRQGLSQDDTIVLNEYRMKFKLTLV